MSMVAITRHLAGVPRAPAFFITSLFFLEIFLNSVGVTLEKVETYKLISWILDQAILRKKNFRKSMQDFWSRPR